jgi:hypothetical protein
MARRKRSMEEIRAEIQAERAQLDTSLHSLVSEVKHSARLAGAGVATLGGLRLAVRLFRRR